MNNLTRYFNQNRKMIWIVIFVVIFVIIVIQLLNSFYKNSNKEEVGNSTSSNVTQKDYTNESQAMVQGSIGSKEKQNEYGALIEEFLTYCVNGQVSQAYSLLSNDCKKILYPTEKSFELNYYKSKFDTKKTYDFQLWSAIDKTYVYQVRIYGDMLSSGMINNEDYIQDYFSVIQDDNVYRINVSGYVKSTTYGYNVKSAVERYMERKIIPLKSLERYHVAVMELISELYHFMVNNYSDKNIFLNPLESYKTLYLVDDKDNHINAMLTEITEDDFLVNANESKNIDIKFNRAYTTTTNVTKVCFERIIRDYDSFLTAKETYNDVFGISIEL